MLDCNTCSSCASDENMGIRSLFSDSNSTTLANSPNLPAAALRTIGVSSWHKLRK